MRLWRLLLRWLRHKKYERFCTKAVRTTVSDRVFAVFDGRVRELPRDSYDNKRLSGIFSSRSRLSLFITDFSCVRCYHRRRRRCVNISALWQKISSLWQKISAEHRLCWKNAILLDLRTEADVASCKSHKEAFLRAFVYRNESCTMSMAKLINSTFYSFFSFMSRGGRSRNPQNFNFINTKERWTANLRRLQSRPPFCVLKLTLDCNWSLISLQRGVRLTQFSVGIDDQAG